MSRMVQSRGPRLGPSIHPAKHRDPSLLAQPALARGLFLLCACATATIWIGDPFVGWAYDLGAMFLACWASLAALKFGYSRAGRNALWILVGIAAWGWVQLAGSTTVYRYATWNASMRMSACAATALASSIALRNIGARHRFLTGVAWFGFAVSIVGTLAYYTSPNKILWIFPSSYSDTWGPFLSRNDFAALLELSFPPAVWAAQIPRQSRCRFLGEGRIPIWVPACMLAAGWVSASRAGALLLLAEAVFLFGSKLFFRLELAGTTLLGPTLFGAEVLGAKPLGSQPERDATPAPKGVGGRIQVAQFVAFTLAASAVGGMGTLLARLAAPNPLQYRVEMALSALCMFRERPAWGYGLGTFPQVYPAFATFDAGALVNHAHNDWLEWAAEGGLPFILLWLTLFVWMIRPAWRSVWGLGLLAVFIHGLVDYPFAKCGLTAWIFAFIGALQAESERNASSSALI